MDQPSLRAALEDAFACNPQLRGYVLDDQGHLRANVVAFIDGARCHERVMLADHPVLPLYFYVNKHLVKPWVRGWTDNVMNVVYSKDIYLAAPAA